MGFINYLLFSAIVFISKEVLWKMKTLMSFPNKNLKSA